MAGDGGEGGVITTTVTTAITSPANGTMSNNFAQIEDERVTQETVKCFCRGLVTTLVTSDGWWKIQ